MEILKKVIETLIKSCNYTILTFAEIKKVFPHPAKSNLAVTPATVTDQSNTDQFLFAPYIIKTIRSGCAEPDRSFGYFEINSTACQTT